MQNKSTLLIAFTVVTLAIAVPVIADAQRIVRVPYRGGHFRPSPRFHRAPSFYSYGHPYTSIRFGSSYYRYQRGYYYRPYGSSFQLIAPPIGIRISTLPIGYRRVMVGPDPYYYYNNAYYRQDGREYEVVAPPLGSYVDELPAGARVKVINGVKYYEQDGTYYEEQVDNNGNASYRVAGTDGVLNTDAVDVMEEPAIGDRFDELPADCKTVLVQGEELFLAPDGLYYKEVKEDNKTVYEVVGK